MPTRVIMSRKPGMIPNNMRSPFRISDSLQHTNMTLHKNNKTPFVSN